MLRIKVMKMKKKKVMEKMQRTNLKMEMVVMMVEMVLVVKLEMVDMVVKKVLMVRLEMELVDMAGMRQEEI